MRHRVTIAEYGQRLDGRRGLQSEMTWGYTVEDAVAAVLTCARRQAEAPGRAHVTVSVEDRTVAEAICAATEGLPVTVRLVDSREAHRGLLWQDGKWIGGGDA